MTNWYVLIPSIIIIISIIFVIYWFEETKPYDPRIINDEDLKIKAMLYEDALYKKFKTMYPNSTEYFTKSPTPHSWEHYPDVYIDYFLLVAQSDNHNNTLVFGIHVLPKPIDAYTLSVNSALVDVFVRNGQYFYSYKASCDTDRDLQLSDVSGPASWDFLLNNDCLQGLWSSDPLQWLK